MRLRSLLVVIAILGPRLSTAQTALTDGVLALIRGNDATAQRILQPLADATPQRVTLVFMRSDDDLPEDLDIVERPRQRPGLRHVHEQGVGVLGERDVSVQGIVLSVGFKP